MNAAQGQVSMFTAHDKKPADVHPNPAYYALLPITIPADIVAAPVEFIIFSNQDWAP